MKQVMPHDPEVKKPSEIQNYNDALNSLSQKNDDTLFEKRTGSSMIPTLMPAPEIGENDSEPPPIPPKESKSVLTPVEMPELDLKRETHLVRFYFSHFYKNFFRTGRRQIISRAKSSSIQNHKKSAKL